MAKLALKKPCPRWSPGTLRRHFTDHGMEIAAAIPADPRFFEIGHYDRESRTTFSKRVIGFDAENWEYGRLKDEFARYSIDGRALLAVAEVDDSWFRTFYPVGKDGPIEAGELVSMTPEQRRAYAFEWALKRCRSKKFRKVTNCHGIPC